MTTQHKRQRTNKKIHTKHTHKTKDRLKRLYGKTTMWVYYIWIWDLFWFDTKQTAGSLGESRICHLFLTHINIMLHMFRVFNIYITIILFCVRFQLFNTISCYICHLITHQTYLLYIFSKLLIFLWKSIWFNLQTCGSQRGHLESVSRHISVKARSIKEYQQRLIASQWW